MRKAEVTRKTKETEITAVLDLDGSIESEIDTGVPFFDHMLDSFAKHGGFGVEINVDSDLEVDFHHTIEDTGLVLGKALKEAVDLDNINRFGFASIPMDESLCKTSLDFCGRSYFKADLPRLELQGARLVVFRHFFRSLANEAGITLHLEAFGDIGHHVCEAMFKSFAIALKEAVVIRDGEARTTKGVLDD